MSQVTVTLTFDTPAQAAAFLAGKGQSPAASPAPAASPSSAPASAAPSQSAPDFDKDIMPALKAANEKAGRDKFVAMIKEVGGTDKVAALKPMTDKHVELLKRAKALAAG